MKKIAAALLALLLCLTLCACGKSEAVIAVESMISQLGEITLDSEEAIIASEIAYGNLSEKEKEKVENYPVLLDARDAYEKIPKFVEVAVEKEIWVVSKEESLLGTYEYSGYEYNDQGQITQFVRAQLLGFRKSEVLHYLEYDDQGRLVSENSVSGYGYEKVNYVYNAEGYIEREYWTSDFSVENGKEFIYTYTFDENGQIAMKTCTNINSDYVLEYTYVYNEDGTVARERQHSNSGSTYITEYVYDENGNVIEEHISELNNSSDGWINYYSYECIGTYTVYEIHPVK